MAEQARAAAQKQAGQGAGAGQPQAGFDPGAAQALRQQIGQIRQLAENELEKTEAEGTGQGGVDRGPGVAPLDHTHSLASSDGARFDAQGFDTQQSRETVLLGKGLSRKGEAPVNEPHGSGARAFEAGTDAEFWNKRLDPRQRAVLERYFQDPP
jgi:hypothetical protein